MPAAQALEAGRGNPPVRIVIVDDHDAFRGGMARAAAQHAGVALVGEAAGGLAAIALLDRVRPDIALVDVRMPLVDGLAVCRQAGCPVVLYSAEPDARAAAFRAGAAAFVEKSRTRTEILDAVLAAFRAR